MNANAQMHHLAFWISKMPQGLCSSMWHHRRSSGSDRSQDSIRDKKIKTFLKPVRTGLRLRDSAGLTPGETEWQKGGSTTCRPQTRPTLWAEEVGRSRKLCSLRTFQNMCTAQHWEDELLWPIVNSSSLKIDSGETLIRIKGWRCQNNLKCALRIYFFTKYTKKASIQWPIEMLPWIQNFPE